MPPSHRKTLIGTSPAFPPSALHEQQKESTEDDHARKQKNAREEDIAQSLADFIDGLSYGSSIYAPTVDGRNRADILWL